MGIDIQQAIDRLTVLARAANVNTALFDAEGRRLMFSDCAPGCALCQRACASKEGLLRCTEFHRDAGLTAGQTGSAYIARCHVGAVAITAPRFAGEKYVGSAAFLPLWLWAWDGDAEAELNLRGRELRLSDAALREAGQSVPSVDAARANALANLLLEAVADDAEEALFPHALSGQQRRIRELIAERGPDDASPRPHDYPIHLEREMLGRVRLGDKNGARAMLNELLAHIFLRSPGNMELIKARLLELVVMISRAAVESGAGLERLLGLNYNFISELSAIGDVEALSAWVVKVLDAFLEAVYESRGFASSRQLTDALSYIRSHHMRSLTLEEVAAQVFVSPFYLSHLFKEKLGVTFVEYLTRVRVEMAKNYLLNTQLPVAAIAERVGYEDASYFGKVFKRLTGTTPKGFRRGA